MQAFKSLWVLALFGVHLIGCVAKEEMVAMDVQQEKTYIVCMANLQKPQRFIKHALWYKSVLNSASKSAQMIYAYSSVFNGFSARMLPAEAKLLEQKRGVVSVLAEIIYQLHTTRTPEFLGLSGAHETTAAEWKSASEVIVGVFDTGVWRYSKSFVDTGFGPLQRPWNGTCETGKNFNSSACNLKLIGARYFSAGYEKAMGPINETRESKSPADDHGHGTHTASTVAGSLVEKASLFGYANGVARGMAVNCRVAVYKICWAGGCSSSDILAAMDQAVEDGVDIMSLSLGPIQGAELYMDPITIGAFGAMEKGILISTSAGNSGPALSSLGNPAPWVVTVGAGKIDRDFPANVILGNGKILKGVSLYNGSEYVLPNTPLVYAPNTSNANSTEAHLCKPGSLLPGNVAGKIVLCIRGDNPRAEKGLVVKKAGGVGMILANPPQFGEELIADAHIFPATSVGENARIEIMAYINSTSTPTTRISFQHKTVVGVKPAPQVAAFSSRGPNSINPWILKPDLIAPGLNILAAWTNQNSPTGLDDDLRRVHFNITSGTSMSCPHISGIAALLKATHPDWSPAAIQSALMTSAYTTDKDGENIKDLATSLDATPFSIGSGHVNPHESLDPGLIYDRTAEDYLGFLCALNYTSDQISTITRTNFTCDVGKIYAVENLNYPSFAVALNSSMTKTTVVHKRTLTNVGEPSTYQVSIYSAEGLKITVQPKSLSFCKLYEKKSYTATFKSTRMTRGTKKFGKLVWSDAQHFVTSPFAVTWD